MESIEEKNRKRLEFLKLLYEKSQGIRLPVHTEDLASELNFTEVETHTLAKYLHDKGLIKLSNLTSQITPDGVNEIEAALSKPDESTEYFPPVNIINNYGSMHNSQIMQGSNRSNQTFDLNEETLKNLEKFIELFEKRFSELEFKSENDEKETIAEIQTIKAQVKSPKPKEMVIKESRKTLRNILEGMTGSILATELLKLLLGV